MKLGILCGGGPAPGLNSVITTQRWYLVVAMSRSAGHLALGIGKAAGA